MAQLFSPDEMQLVVMPNPATEQVQLIWPEITKTEWVSRFVDASGCERPVTIVANQMGLLANIQHLSTGVYIWQVAMKGGPPLSFRVMKVE